jgi:hypothetical protein
MGVNRRPATRPDSGIENPHRIIFKKEGMMFRGSHQRVEVCGPKFGFR